jgi:hypothetical protein
MSTGDGANSKLNLNENGDLPGANRDLVPSRSLFEAIESTLQDAFWMVVILAAGLLLIGARYPLEQ